jgi:WD40 repeat protein
MSPGVQWRSGRWLASSGWDNLIQVWDAITGAAGQRMRNPDDPYTNFYGVAWSPDGHRLASGSFRREVQMWEVATGSRQWVVRQVLNPLEGDELVVTFHRTDNYSGSSQVPP